MTSDTLAEVLENEHQEIDAGIAEFLADPGKPLALNRAIASLRRHIYVEEQIVFPPLFDSGMAPPILVMQREHGEIWRTMVAIEASIDQGLDAVTVDLCRQLLAQLERHNAKEETVIYPEADGALDARTAAALRSFLEHGEMPTGWVCREVN